MSGLEVFNNDEFGQVRILIIKNEPYFIAKDVVDALGYKKGYTDVLKQQCYEDDYVLYDKTHLSFLNYLNYRELGQRGGYLINESGLYSLIINCELIENDKKQKIIEIFQKRGMLQNIALFLKERKEEGSRKRK